MYRVPAMILSAVLLIPIAGGDEAPTGAAIVERFIAAVGGSAALSKIDSFHVRGRYEIPAAGLKGTIELFFRRPDQMIFRVMLPGYGTIERGMSGGRLWSTDPGRGTRWLEGAEADQVRKLTVRGLSVLPDPDAYADTAWLETVEEDGRTLHRVRIRLRDPALEYVELYDADTGLMAGREEQVPGPQGEAELTGQAGAYQRFDEVLIPTAWSHQFPGQEWNAVYESVELDAISPAAATEIFAVPKEPQTALTATGTDGR